MNAAGSLSYRLLSGNNINTVAGGVEGVRQEVEANTDQLKDLNTKVAFFSFW